MASKPGGIVGLVIALLIVGGLAGTPFYLRMLQSEPRALDVAVADDVEAVRRIVLNLDEPISAYASMSASVESGQPEPSDEGYRTPTGFPDDDPVFSKQLIRDLNQTVELLQRVEAADRSRGTTVLGTETVDHRRLKVNRVTNDFKTKYLKAHEKRLRDADAALGSLRSVSRGASSSTNHLGVNRMKGIFLLAKGRIQANKAQFERLYASLLRRAALDRVPALLELRRQESTIEAQRPQQRSAAVDTRLKETQAGLAAVQGAMKQLNSLVQAKQEQLSELEKSAAEAQQALSRLGSQRLAFADYSSRYLELSAQARTSEAEAQALRYGTLRDAVKVETSDAEPKPPSYEGGTPEPGLDTLSFRLDMLKEQQALLQNTQKELETQRKSLEELEQSQTAQYDDVVKKIEEQASGMTEWLAQADAHEEKAAKAEEDAMKSLKEAMRSAKDAVTAAKRMSGDARLAAGTGGAVDERLQRVSLDVDTESSMHCLVAECAYTMGLLQCEHAAAARERMMIAGILAPATGQNAAAPSDELDKILIEAANHAADALKAYEQAGTLIGKAGLKSGNVSISGKNYLWQVQVGQAAAHLLLAAIHTEDADKADSERTLAYNLLKEAAEKREQSPLLTPAIETVTYLQKSAR